MTWYHNSEPVTSIDDQYKGFVYIITNLIDGRQYIGLKLTKFAKTKQVKGKKKRVFVESDWQEYWSSSVELQDDVKRLGPENFKREILHLCKLKAHCNYLEAREQFDRRVLEQPDKWYNSIINCRVHRNHIKNI